MNKTINMNVRISEYEKKQLTKEAQMNKIKLSELVRLKLASSEVTPLGMKVKEILIPSKQNAVAELLRSIAPQPDRIDLAIASNSVILKSNTLQPKKKTRAEQVKDFINFKAFLDKLQ